MFMTTESLEYPCNFPVCLSIQISRCTKHHKPELHMKLILVKTLISFWLTLIELSWISFFPCTLKRIFIRELKKSLYIDNSSTYKIYLCSISNLQFIFRLIYVLRVPGTISTCKHLKQTEAMIVNESGAEGVSKIGSPPQYLGINNKVNWGEIQSVYYFKSFLC